MIERLVHGLIASPNEAADDVLLEALDLGNGVEKRVALGAILRRGKVRGLAGVVGRYEGLPGNLKLAVLDHIGAFGQALSESGRSLDVSRRLAAMKLIALGRQGRLGYVLLENLGDGEERLQRGAVEGVVALARWVASETRRVQGQGARGEGQVGDLIAQRGEIESVVFKALERQRSGVMSADLTRAALLLADSGTSQTLAILRLSRHPGRVAMERRLSQPPASEHVEGWLLGASHAGMGPVRSAFAGTFAHVHERPVLDGLLRKSHWLKDQKLQACVGNVMGGRWMDQMSLARDLKKRSVSDVPGIAEWVAGSGCAEVLKDLLLATLLEKAKEDAGVRLRVLRVVMGRPRGASVQLLKELLGDEDERVRRVAAREIARRRPVGYQNMLMGAMAGAPASVGRVIGRAVGGSGFRAYWRRYERLEEGVRRSAGRTVVRIVPGATQRLAAMLGTGDATERVRVLQLARETDMVEGLRGAVMRLLGDGDVRVRSKAVSATGGLRPVPEGALVECVERDGNARVRANAIEVLAGVRARRLVPVLAGRVRSENNRERANAIKALLPLEPGAARLELLGMLQDARPMHRVSALWALRAVRSWDRLADVGRMARQDPDLAVRRYAIGVLKSAADQMRAEKAEVA
jgi:HEAT repeat protein